MQRAFQRAEVAQYVEAAEIQAVQMMGIERRVPAIRICCDSQIAGLRRRKSARLSFLNLAVKSALRFTSITKALGLTNLAGSAHEGVCGWVRQLHGPGNRKGRRAGIWTTPQAAKRREAAGPRPRVT